MYIQSIGRNAAQVIILLDQFLSAKREFTLFMISVDGLDSILPLTLGQLWCDRMIQEIYTKLASAFPSVKIAHMPPDRFALFTGQFANEQNALVFAADIRRELHSLLKTNELNLSVAILTKNSSLNLSAENLLSMITATMQMTQQKGRGLTEFFHQASYQDWLVQAYLAQLFAGIIDSGQFDGERIGLHYQPIVKLTTGFPVLAMEALLRVPDKEISDCHIPAYKAIQIATKAGLIHPLTFLILRQACQDAQIWRSRYANSRLLGVSVNVPASMLALKDFAASVYRILKETSFSPSLLFLEMTEADKINAHDLEAADKSVTALERANVHLMADDFGQGHSMTNLNWKCAIVKLDRSLLSGNPHTQNSKAKMLVDWAQTHCGAQTVAEGIEDHKHLERVRKWGCSFVQGYLISRPQPIEGLIPMLNLGAWEPGQTYAQ